MHRRLRVPAMTAAFLLAGSERAPAADPPAGIEIALDFQAAEATLGAVAGAKAP